MPHPYCGIKIVWRDYLMTHSLVSASSFKTINFISKCWQLPGLYLKYNCSQNPDSDISIPCSLFPLGYLINIWSLTSKTELLTCLQSLFAPHPYSSPWMETLASAFQLLRPKPLESFLIPFHSSLAFNPSGNLWLSLQLYPEPTFRHLYCYHCGLLSLRLQKPPNLNCSESRFSIKVSILKGSDENCIHQMNMAACSKPLPQSLDTFALCYHLSRLHFPTPLLLFLLHENIRNSTVGQLLNWLPPSSQSTHLPALQHGARSSCRHFSFASWHSCQ